MSHTCKGKCTSNNLKPYGTDYTTHRRGFWSILGIRRCSICEYGFVTLLTNCICCGSKFKFTPSNTKAKQKLVALTARRIK